MCSFWHGTVHTCIPFHFTLVIFHHRTACFIYSNADIYQSGDMRVELEGFIKFIAKSFKKLPPEGIADGLRTFLQR